MNLQFIASSHGDVLWVSGGLPGLVHDKRAEWTWGVLRNWRPLARRTEANRAHAKLRAPGERANAQLKTWKILAKARCCPTATGKLAKAIHVPQLREA